MWTTKLANRLVEFHHEECARLVVSLWVSVSLGFARSGLVITLAKCLTECKHVVTSPWLCHFKCPRRMVLNWMTCCTSAASFCRPHRRLDGYQSTHCCTADDDSLLLPCETVGDTRTHSVRRGPPSSPNALSECSSTWACTFVNLRRCWVTKPQLNHKQALSKQFPLFLATFFSSALPAKNSTHVVQHEKSAMSLEVRCLWLGVPCNCSAWTAPEMLLRRGTDVLMRSSESRSFCFERWRCSWLDVVALGSHMLEYARSWGLMRSRAKCFAKKPYAAREAPVLVYSGTSLTWFVVTAKAVLVLFLN